MQAPTPKFEEWLAAEQEARDAERALHAAMLQFGRGVSAPPLDDLVQSARTLRQRAHGLFDEAMQEMKGVAESLHHRRVLSGAPSSLQRNSRPEDGGDSGAASSRLQQ